MAPVNQRANSFNSPTRCQHSEPEYNSTKSNNATSGHVEIVTLYINLTIRSFFDVRHQMNEMGGACSA